MATSQPNSNAGEFVSHILKSTCQRNIAGECFIVAASTARPLPRTTPLLMHITRHQNFASLAEHLPVWNELARGVPFCRWEWLEAWWRHYGCQPDGRTKGDHELFVLTVSDDNGQLVGIVPWYRLHTRSGAKVIRFLGDGEVCSDYLTILCRIGNEVAVAELLADWLTAINGREKRNKSGHRRYQTPVESTDNDADCRWDRLEVSGVDAGDSAVNLLLAKLEARGNRLHHCPAMNTWRVALTKSWEEFLMTQSKPHRNRLRRADKNYFQTGRVIVHCVQSKEQVSKFFDILVQLHQGRWQRRGQPGCFASQLFYNFHREIAERFVHSGDATLSWLELDGTPLAAEYRLHGETTMYAYQCGIDADRLKVQPGELANMAAVRHAIEHGQAHFDFLRGDEPYKAHWRAVPRPQLLVRVVPKCTSARLRHTAWVAGQNMKQWVKSGLQLAHLRAAPKSQKQSPTAAASAETAEEEVSV